MHIVLKLSKLCNLRCTYCYEFADLAKRDRMPLDQFDQFLETLTEWHRRSASRSDLHFVLHGGEPMLLPLPYLEAVFESISRRVGGASINFSVSLQTNLTHYDPERLELLVRYGASMGVSLDVFGGQRRSLAGKDAQNRVLTNLQRLIDDGYVDRLRVGAIAVLHRANVGDAVRIYEFYRQLGISFRLLPVFSMEDPPEGMHELTLAPEQVVRALLEVAKAQFRAESSPIVVYPLLNHLTAAVNHLAGVSPRPYDPDTAEWAMIVDTNGDAYSHADAYTPEGFFGNIFEDDFDEMMHGPARAAAVRTRQQRGKLCRGCPFDRACSGLPVIEALPSERFTDETGHPACAVARPVIESLLVHLEAHEDLREQIRATADAHAAGGIDA